MLLDLMGKRIMDEMGNVLRRATRKRKSDSIPGANTPGLGALQGMPQLPAHLRESGADTFSLRDE